MRKFLILAFASLMACGCPAKPTGTVVPEVTTAAPAPAPVPVPVIEPLPTLSWMYAGSPDFIRLVEFNKVCFLIKIIGNDKDDNDLMDLLLEDPRIIDVLNSGFITGYIGNESGNDQMIAEEILGHDAGFSAIAVTPAKDKDTTLLFIPDYLGEVDTSDLIRLDEIRTDISDGLTQRLFDDCVELKSKL